MQVGICTRYTCHESSFIAVRAADWLQQNNFDVSIYAASKQRNKKLGFRWDSQVVSVNDALFTDWAKNVETIVWTTLPSVPQIEWCRKLKKRVVIVPLWHEIDQSDRGILSLADIVLCPVGACYHHFKRWGLTNVKLVPWDTGYPFFVKPANYKIADIKLFLPLWDGNARRTEFTAVDLLDRAMARSSDVKSTIAYTSSTLSGVGVRRLKQLQKDYGSRVVLLCGGVPAARDRLFHDQDLTLWPTHWESTNITGLLSRTAGTPVLGFNFKPTDEILPRMSRLSISCEESFNDVGLPMAVPDYVTMDSHLHTFINDPKQLREEQLKTLNGLSDRRNFFNQGMMNCFCE